MDKAKVLEFLNQTMLTDFMQKLLSMKLNKLTLFGAFPITSAPNISDPRHFVMVEEVGGFISFKPPDFN